MDNETMFSHNRADWETPEEILLPLDREFYFDLDIAANTDNHKFPCWYGPGGIREDALVGIPWECGAGWCNPPYGVLVPQFVSRGIEAIAAKTVDVVVYLLAARTDTKWFHLLCRAGAEHRFISGRLKFEIEGKPILDANGRPVGAPFPSLISILRQPVHKWSILHA